MKEKNRAQGLIRDGSHATKRGLILLCALASILFMNVSLAGEPPVTQTALRWFLSDGRTGWVAPGKGKPPAEQSQDTFLMPQGHTKMPKGAPLPLALAPGYYQTSGFMLGKVAVGLVMPQCNGALDPCTETWTTTAMDQVYNQVKAAMNWWSQRLNGRVTFMIEERRQVPTSYEPIRHPRSDEGLWISEVMTQMGFRGTVYGDQVYAYNNYLRQTYKTDWAFTLFVVNSLNSPSGTFSDGYFSYAYLQGPFAVATYDNGGYGISGMAAVVAHETGHIFGALDEFAGAGTPCHSTSGYLLVENQNSQQGCALNQDSIMRGGTTPYNNNLVDPYALGMVGYRISNANGLPDPINTTPLVTLDPISSPTSNLTPTITGIAQDQPYVPPSGAAYTINYIVNVQYRVDGGAWQNATPSDGSASFNQVAQGFTFRPTLNPGTHLIEVRAINRVNAVSSIVSATLVVQSPTATLSPTLAPASATPTALPTNTPTYTPAPSVGALCVLVYNDSNGNGARDSSETRLAGAQITVKNSNNQVVGSWTTDGINEPRCFTNLPPGPYTVTEINPPNYVSTTPDTLATSVYAGLAFGLEFGDKPVAPTNTPTRTPTTAPTSSAVIDAPNGLKATVSAGAITLTWNASRTAGVTFTVYRGTSSTALTPLTTGITDLAYRDTQVAPGGGYYYYVTASQNGAESKPSNTVRVVAR